MAEETQTWPTRIKVNGVEYSAHAPWCPIEQLRAASGEQAIEVLPGLQCRCHLQAVEELVVA